MGILKQSLNTISRNKLWCTAMMIIQPVYLILFSYVGFVYSLRIMENVNYLLGRIAEITPEQIVEKTVENPLAIYSHYSQFISNILMLVFLSYILYIVLNGMNWNITNKIVNKGKLAGYFIPYALASLVFLIPLFLIFSGILRLVSITGFNEFFLGVGIAAALIFFYFMHISFSLIDRYKLRDFFKMIKSALIIGVKKAKILVPISASTFLIIAMIAALIATAVDMFWAMTLLIILLLAVLVWARIVFMMSVNY